MKFINFLVVKLSVSYTAGIVVAYFAALPFYFILKLLCILLIVLLIVLLRERNVLKPGVHFGIMVYGAFFILGAANYELRLPQNSKRHYSHFSTDLTSEVIQLKITKVLRSNSRYQKYFARVLQQDHRPTQGEILLSIPKDSIAEMYAIDDLLMVFGKLDDVLGPLNPHQFDYRKYLQHQGVHHQIRLSEDRILASKEGSTTMVGLASKIRLHLIEKLAKQPIGFRERSIMQALLLGERSNIEKDLYAQYASAGALHILAVSGLHVGIIFILLSRLFSPLERFKRGKIIKIILIVSLLWSFALLAGLSASVVRAVTMFSLFALANSLRRPTNAFNTLFLSYLILLIVNPNWLFHVGFQFSYLAVFFILWIQPKLYKWHIPKYQIDKQLWSIFTVTIAAQLGIAPLSIYYFHQFPGLFFISNLVILPFLGIILSGGIAVLLLALINTLPYQMAIIYNEMIRLLNNFVIWVAQQEAFLFKEISFSLGRMIASYLIIVFLLRFLIQKKGKRLTPILSSVIFLLGIVIWENKTNSREELVVFQASRSTAIGHRIGSKLRLFEKDSYSFADRFPVKNYRIGSGVSKITSEAIPDVFSFKGKTFLIIDSLAVIPSEEIDVLLLTQSPGIHLERVIDRLRPNTIIADGSNFPWVVERWRVTCQNRNIKFHHTGIEGAFILRERKEDQDR